VAKAELPPPVAGTLSNAKPKVYSRFIDRFDVWNASGALSP